MPMTGGASALEILSSRFLIHPRDYDKSVAFYREVVGLHPMREFGRGDGRGIVFFLGGGFLELTGTSPEGATSFSELWLQVRNLSETERRLRDADVPIVESARQKPWGLVEMRATDPDGLVLIFVEVPEDHPMRRDHRSL